MQDHGLFQAVCRVNRLDDKDTDEASAEAVFNKDYGYIVDYRDLFKKLEKSVNDYTSGALAGFAHEDVIGLLKDKNEMGKEDLETALEVVAALCEPVPAPRGTAEYIRYFCGDTENVYSLKENEQKRQKLYKAVSSLVRKYEELAGDMKAVGYNAKSIEKIKAEVEHYQTVSNEVKRASGDWIDLKKYDKDMRNLFDQYILAKDSEVLNNFNNDGLLKLIVDESTNASDGFDNTTAETIENNVRRMISDEHKTNPKYYDKMSALLTELIKQRHQKNIEYREYLKKIAELAKQVKDPSVNDTIPGIDTRGKRALYDALDFDKDKAIMVFNAVKAAAKDGWRGHPIKRRAVKQAIQNCDVSNAEQIMDIVVNNAEF
jgi:type I restriction enzyme R subunit